MAIEQLHKTKTVHRNIKPENIYIGSDGYIKIGDFTFTKIIDEDVTYTVCGTPNYMAPELILHKGHSYGVDWWAIGVLLYELLIGIDPFADEDVMKIYENILKTRPLFPDNFD